MPQEPGSNGADGGKGRKGCEERGLKGRTDKAIGGAAAGIQGLGGEKPASAFEEDRGVAAFVDGVSRAQNGEEDREEREHSGPGWRRRAH